MSALTAVVRIGSRPPLGGGIEPSFVAHLYGSAWPRFVVYEVRPADDATAGGGGAGPALTGIGTYAPAFDADSPSPLTDLLLATSPRRSVARDLLTTLDTKSKANYDTSFREKIFDGDVSRGSPGYGRLFEARSQLEAHPYDGAIVVGFHAGVAPIVEKGIRENAARLDAEIEILERTPVRRRER